MNTTLLHVRRLAMAAAALGAVLSPFAASAQSQLDVAEAQAFLGNWNLSLQTDFGPFDLELKIEDQGGKVAAMVGSEEAGGLQNVTNITRSGEKLVLTYEIDAQGQITDVVLTLEPDDDALSAEFDVAGGTFTASGRATKVTG